MNGLFIMGALIFAGGGAIIAWDGLVERSVRISSGKKGKPSVTVAAFQGSDAARVGTGGLLLTAGSVCLFLGACKARQAPWTPATRRLLEAALVLLLASVLLFFPPWLVRFGEVSAGYYAFLVPALLGTWLNRRRKGVFVAVLVFGALLSVALGPRANPVGLMSALLTYLFVGLLLYCLLEERRGRTPGPRESGFGTPP